MAKTVILALAYGVGGAINQPLKREVERLEKHLSCEVFTQHDLLAILNINNIKVAIQTTTHISSLAVIQQFIDWLKINDYREVYLVAAKQHICRCHRDLKKLAPSGVNITLRPISVPYIPDVQPWVTSPLRWWKRELIIRLLPWSLYKRLCG